MTARSALLAACLIPALAATPLSTALAQSAAGTTTTSPSGDAAPAPSSEPAPISPLSSPQNQPQQNPDDDKDKKPAPPAALPGAMSATDAAPATMSAKDMDPNTALFDAVNRGDIEGAKDALNRGADLTATNALGQTPIDMSIDLDRHAITFLLLSMRQGGAATGAPAVAYAADNAPAKHGHRKGHATTKAATEDETSLADAADNNTPRVRTIAAGGGTPLPSAGFLGFGH